MEVIVQKTAQVQISPDSSDKTLKCVRKTPIHHNVSLMAVLHQDIETRLLMDLHEIEINMVVLMALAISHHSLIILMVSSKISKVLVSR